VAQFDWHWPRFWWGSFGGMASQVFAVYPTAAAIGWGLLTILPGLLLFSAFGGCVSVAAAQNSPLKCIAYGAATPLIITLLMKNAPQMIAVLLK
jgi:hypothetical protein